jgi:excisionase family DNA binding protein
MVRSRNISKVRLLVDFGRQLGVSNYLIRRLAAEGKIQSLRLGSRIYVTEDEIRRYCAANGISGEVS